MYKPIIKYWENCWLQQFVLKIIWYLSWHQWYFLGHITCFTEFIMMVPEVTISNDILCLHRERHQYLKGEESILLERSCFIVLLITLNYTSDFQQKFLKHTKKIPKKIWPTCRKINSGNKICPWDGWILHFLGKYFWIYYFNHGSKLITNYVLRIKENI